MQWQMHYFFKTPPRPVGDDMCDFCESSVTSMQTFLPDNVTWVSYNTKYRVTLRGIWNFHESQSEIPHHWAPRKCQIPTPWVPLFAQNKS